MDKDNLIALQKSVRNVAVDRKVASYIVMLVNATRTDTRVRIGCSPRGSKMLLRAAQARAVLQGREFVLPDDVQALAVDVMSHRISLRSSGVSSDDAAHVVRDVVKSTEVPV